MTTDPSTQNSAGFQDKDRLSALMSLYQCEVQDNSEIYRRATLLITVTTALLSGLLFVARWGGVPTTSVDWASVGWVICAATLLITLIYLGLAIYPQAWAYIDSEVLVSDKATPSDTLIHIKEIVERNRETNTQRYEHLRRAMFTMILTLLSLAACSVTILSRGPSSGTTASASTPLLPELKR